MKYSPKIRRAFAFYCVLVMFTVLGVTVYATDDPIAVVKNLSDFIFGLIRAIGLILLGFGIVQVGLYLNEHNASDHFFFQNQMFC